MNRISFLNRGYAFKGLLAVYIPEYYAHKCIKKCTSINQHFERHHFMKNKSVRRYSLKSVLLKDNVLKMQI